MKLIFKIASAFLLLAWTSIAVNAQTESTKENWELLKKQALSEKKIILVDLYFTGCAPCAQMDKEVFPDPKVAKVLSADYVTFKSDILKEEIGKELSMKYGVTGFPTFVLLNSEGKVIDIAIGFHNVDQFTALLQTTKENAKKGLLKKYSAGIQEQDYPDFYKQAYLANKRNVSFETADAYLKAQPTLLAEVPYVIITGLRIGRQYDDFFLKNLKTYAADFAKADSHVFTILNRKKKQFEKTNDLASFKKLMDEVKYVFTPEDWTKFEGILLKDFGAAPAPKQYELTK